MSEPPSGVTRQDSLHQQVARHIRNDIEAGVLRDGDVLPSTRELATRWDVSVFTISEAMRVLAEEGLVVGKSRSKRVVRAPGQARTSEIRLRVPRVLMIGGYAGSGKTELGRILARETGWPMLDKDTLTRPVVEAALEVRGMSPNDRESETYLSWLRPREYEALAAATEENVACGNSAIVTAPFIREFKDSAWIKRTEAAHTALGARTVLVWVYCDVETMHRYIRHRGAARDASKLAAWDEYVNAVDVTARPAGAHLVVENSVSARPLQAQARELLEKVLGPDAP